MSDPAARAHHAAAMEERRRRIDELRNRRERRVAGTAQISANLDDYIDGLLSQPSVVPAVGADVVEDNGSPTTGTTTAADPPRPSTSTTTTDAAMVPAEQNSNVIAETSRTAKTKMVETFAVGTQTETGDFPAQPEDQEVEDEAEEPHPPKTTVAGDENLVEDPSSAGPKVLSGTQVEKEVNSTPFSSFINTASKKVERVLGAPLLADLLVDYVGEADNVERSDTKDSEAARYVSSSQVFHCDKWTGGRDVTDLDWSPLHRDYLLSTYHLPDSKAPRGSSAFPAASSKTTVSSSLTPRSGELQSDGLALVWSLSMPNRPEHIFTCGSPVITGRFHPSEATLVLGGCESGQLVVWDVRAGRLPVQKSSLTTAKGKGHKHPICAMEVIEGGAGLVTGSSDGRINFWSLANLRDPADSLQVGESLSCLAAVPESESLIVADEHGSLYTVPGGVSRASRKQVTKWNPSDDEGESQGHYGMVTALSTKVSRKDSAKSISKDGFAHGTTGLLLSAGVDWTVKLWSPATRETPLLSFVSHSYDYISDVQWSPVHPALFSTVSSNGSMSLWNLGRSLEEPLTTMSIDTDRGLNKLSWSSDGRRVAVAAADEVRVIHWTDDLSNSDDEAKMANELLTRGLITN